MMAQNYCIFLKYANFLDYIHKISLFFGWYKKKERHLRATLNV